MVTIKVFLDKRRITKEETYPLNFRIYHLNKSFTRSSKIYLKENQWDIQKKAIKSNHPNANTLNRLLLKSFADLQSELLLADNAKIVEYLSPKPIQLIEKKPIPTVFSFVSDLISELRTDNKIGNAWVYESAINALKRFHPDESLTFEQIDFEFLDNYNKFLLRRDVKHNTAFFYIRTLRAFYNKAIKLKVVDRNLYPFHDIKLKAERTKKRAIDKTLITAIIELDLPEGSTIWHARNWFMMSFYLMGISFVDLALLQTNNIKNGRIHYKRQKTGKVYDIRVLPQAQKIIDLYSSKRSQNYLLPIINRKVDSEEIRLRLIKDRTRLANKYLKRMAELIETNETITTYTSRHSWATICKKLGFSIEIIAECLGHEYGNKTTAVYLDTFDQEVIDDTNEKVAKSVNC
ncbi:site-specific integrase [Pedobacter gandavensis]|uniref:Tyrosine-type recombinase/integrase n=1 Tax=Pedobacter gandavensis TaxID=2679963 RepID=A0ABR6F2F6_9SPHI|nr:site-specific integrase [Pedobacter gandavensis]MBB2151714.1 tyrosine-type recombinase/integrase [Pedobacter gandavensis]